MAKKTKTKSEFFVGVRVELPTKLITNKDLGKLYKKAYKQKLTFDVTCDQKIAPEYVDDLILAKPSNEKQANLSSFPLFAIFTDLEAALRVIRILNVLGDDKLIRESVRSFMDDKSNLSNLKELSSLKTVFGNMNAIVPHFTELAWFSAPDAIL
jgi:hypothetical protein